MSIARAGSIAFVIIAIVSYGYSLRVLDRNRSVQISPELMIRMPRLVQVLSAAGDRYLAANVAAIRVLVAETKRMRPADWVVQAALQDDVSWMNPAHEDNYYIAANLLPWAGEVDSAERVVRRAAERRANDYLPAFHVGFIQYQFRRNPAEGAAWLLRAAEQTTDQGDQWALQVVAAKWIERGYETATAAQIVDGMAKTAPPGGFKRYLSMRADRLYILDKLRTSVGEYKRRYGKAPGNLVDLVSDGVLEALPKDPMGVGFALTAEGEPDFADRLARAR